MSTGTEVFWIGGATTWGGTPAPGMRALQFDAEGSAHLSDPVAIGPNPMSGAVSPCGSLFVAHEVDEGSLTRFPAPKQFLEGDVPLSVSAPTDGAAPTAVALARLEDGTRLALSANYSGGSLSVNPVGAGLEGPSLVVQYEGSGPVTDRQASPHPHQVVVDGDLVLVPDLGTDQIHVHRLQDLAAGDPAHRDISMPPGSGPRHLVVSDGCAIVACELSGLVRVVSVETGFPITDASPTVRASDAEPNLPSAIRLTKGGHVLVGNRGPNTIGVLKWEPLVESLQYVEEYLCGGSPRDFALTGDETRIVVANLPESNVTVMSFDDAAGTAVVTQTLTTGSPSSAIRQVL